MTFQMRRRNWQSVPTDDDKDEDEDDPEEPSKPPTPVYPVHYQVAAIYCGDWYVAQVEAKEQEKERQGFILLRYRERKGQKGDKLKTILGYCFESGSTPSLVLLPEWVSPRML